MHIYFRSFFLVFLFTGCIKSQKSLSGDLILINHYDLTVPEPSGLSLGKYGMTLWTVSDKGDSRIYQLDLQGNLIKTLPVTGYDFEGIVYDHVQDALWVVEEASREIVKYDTTGKLVERHRLSLKGHANSGLEGICQYADATIYVANEAEPGLIVELNSDFSIRNKFDPEIATDYSGLCCDFVPGRLWIISDEDKLLIHWDVEEGVIETYNLPVKKAEGLAIDFNNSKIYVVSDSEQKLYVFELP